ncbi:MAG TPA: hypothetical protein VFP33_02050 [Gallionella sp.]|nr:hypothetical protein [Gallionella sp.]
MTREKKLGVFAVILLLVALNVWRWWPSAQASSEKTTVAGGAFRLEDFEVGSLRVDSKDPLPRDIFHPKEIAVPEPEVKVEPQDVPPPKSPEELAYEAALAEFAQIRCVGISARDNHFQAYVFSQGSHVLVSKGDKVGSRFVVEKIMSDGVMLRDPDTEVGGEVTISGK